MSEWRDISIGDANMRTRMKRDEVENKLVFVTEQTNIDDCLAMNRAFLNAEKKSSTLWGSASAVRVASIPLEVIEKWWVEDGINFFRASEEDKMRCSKKLNDPDYSALRTAPGRI